MSEICIILHKCHERTTSELEVLERRELQLAHQLHAVHAHERVHHDQLGRGRGGYASFFTS